MVCQFCTASCIILPFTWSFRIGLEITINVKPLAHPMNTVVTLFLFLFPPWIDVPFIVAWSRPSRNCFSVIWVDPMGLMVILNLYCLISITLGVYYYKSTRSGLCLSGAPLCILSMPFFWNFSITKKHSVSLVSRSLELEACGSRSKQSTANLYGSLAQW